MKNRTIVIDVERDGGGWPGSSHARLIRRIGFVIFDRPFARWALSCPWFYRTGYLGACVWTVASAGHAAMFLEINPGVIGCAHSAPVAAEARDEGLDGERDIDGILGGDAQPMYAPRVR